MKKILFTLALLISFISFGQNNKDALRLCSVLQSNSFSSNSAAEDALERILGTIGASKRFVLQPCSNINNAVATSYRGIRYILYDPDFMNTLNYGNNWGNLFILAHEVGHHINGHSLDLVLYAADAVESVSLAQSRQQELEADEFAGFVLSRLGGPISDANEVISKISNNSDDSYSTHPSQSKRLAAVSRGYNKSKTKSNNTKSKKEIANEYFYKGLENNHNGNDGEAINNYTISISLDDSNEGVFLNRGLIYYSNNNNKDAITDLKRAIQISKSKNLDNGSAFLMLGVSMREYDYNNNSRFYLSESVENISKAIEIFQKNSDGEKLPCAYFERGLSQWIYYDWERACNDIKKAKMFGCDNPMINIAAITDNFEVSPCANTMD